MAWLTVYGSELMTEVADAKSTLSYKKAKLHRSFIMEQEDHRQRERSQIIPGAPQPQPITVC